jgi:hypothetical protein
MTVNSTAPDRLEHDQCQREAERDREQEHDDAGAGPEVGLDDSPHRTELAKSRLDVEEHPDEEEPDLPCRDLGHVQKERVGYLSHGRRARGRYAATPCG